MSAEIFQLQQPTLSQMLRAETNLRYAVHLRDIPQAVRDLAGKAPAGDIALAAMRQLGICKNDADIVVLANTLDNILYKTP